MPTSTLLDGLPIPPTGRGARFEPAGFTFGRGVFAPDEVTALQHLYGALEGVYRRWLDDPDRRPEAVSARIDARFVEQLRRAAEALRPRTDHDDEALTELVHDLRGGSLTALTGCVDLIVQDFVASAEQRAEFLQLVVWFARDHAKMMRMALPWLDPVRAAADVSERPHGIDDLIRKWQGALLRVADDDVELRVHARLERALAARCVEAAAVDRVSYNLLNNAARFTSDGAVDLHFDGVSTELGRVCVVNSVTREEREWLAGCLSDDPHALFRSGVTRGGQGDGLASAARLVSSVFGQSPLEAVEADFIGTRVVGQRFAAWFHWPLVSDDEADRGA